MYVRIQFTDIMHIIETVKDKMRLHALVYGSYRQSYCVHSARTHIPPIDRYADGLKHWQYQTTMLNHFDRFNSIDMCTLFWILFGLAFKHKIKFKYKIFFLLLLFCCCVATQIYNGLKWGAFVLNKMNE